VENYLKKLREGALPEKLCSRRLAPSLNCEDRHEVSLAKVLGWGETEQIALSDLPGEVEEGDGGGGGGGRGRLSREALLEDRRRGLKGEAALGCCARGRAMVLRARRATLSAPRDRLQGAGVGVLEHCR